MTVSCAVWFVLLSGVSSCNALHNLFPIDIGLVGENPFLPNERDDFHDCHLRYLKYGRHELTRQESLPPSEEHRGYSHVAAIGWTRSDGTIDWDCMGTLIWENYVLTSAHCTTDGRNAAPDVVRLGGGIQFPDATATTEGQYIQQQKIKQAIPHPEFSPQTGLNDIALLKLEKRITVNTTVAPACLWLAPETVFPKLEFLVRTRGASGSQGSFLSSVESVRTNGSKCGQQDTQLCVETVRTQSAGCLDALAGNPLQVRLLHNFRTSPFLVGIMVGSPPTYDRSSGACSSGAVYTRIGNYRDWIVQQLNSTATPIDFIPGVCARRYAETRPRVDELLLERIGDIPQFTVQLQGQHERYLNYIVQIQWPPGAEGARNDCAGTFVEQGTVLTLAECVAPTPDGQKPTAVLHWTVYRNTSLPIKSITVHPGYVRGSQRNNIAVVKLEKPDDIVPACVWPWAKLASARVDLAGIGYSDLNSNIVDGFDDRDDRSSLVYVLQAADYYPWENCSAQLVSGGANQSLQGLSEAEHICFRNEQWIVPGVCTLLPGAPVQQYIGRAGAFQKYVYALSLAGRFCGFGQPTVAILLEPHIPWLRSVMLGNASGGSGQNSTSDSLIVINPDLKRSDECRNGDGSLGICVPHEMCLSTKERLRAGTLVTLCSVGSVVCCPWGDIARNAEVNPVRAELDTCDGRYRAYREQRWAGRQENESNFSNLPHVAEIGWAQGNGRIAFECIGYLVTTNTVVTSARCAESQIWKPTVVRIGSLRAADVAHGTLQPIRRITLHEDYDDVTGVNNLALIRLTAPIKPSAHYFPGCLFSNVTHVPVRQYVVSFAPSGATTLSIENIFPMYGSDCREATEQPIAEGQMCFSRGSPEGTFVSTNRCFMPSDIMVWEDFREDDAVVPEYLVAIFSHGGCADRNDAQIATRISAYYDWIVNNIK